MTAATRYSAVLGVSAQERERLLQQAGDLAPEARWLLERLAIRPGWRAIDVGCGPLGILDLLSARVGPTGAVVGLDLEPRFVALARELVAERQLDNVQVLQGDGVATGLPRGAFDFVHERLALVGPAREDLLAEMCALARPGGIIAVQEIDLLTWICEPAHPAWDTLLGAFRAFVGQHGADLTIGRRLPELLRHAGLVDVDAEVHAHLARPGEPRRMHLLALIASVRAPLIQSGLVTAAELAALTASLQAHLADPRTVVMRELLVQAWGRKPVA